MEDKTITEVIGAILSILCLGSIVLLVVLCLRSCDKTRQEPLSVFDKYLLEHKCEPFSVEPTGNKVYCGKSCMRDELRHDYLCENGKHLIKVD